MRIDTLTIKHFRCFEDLEIKVHPHLNVFVGVNGSGKTAILDAVKYAVIGALGGIKGSIEKKTEKSGCALREKKDPQTKRFEMGEWTKSDYTEISGKMQLHDQGFDFLRSLSLVNVKYSRLNKYPDFSYVNKEIQKNAPIELPLFAYHSTARLFQDDKDTTTELNGSRLKGYFNAQSAKSSQYFFKSWFHKRERGQTQYQKLNIEFDFSSFESAKKIICQFIPGCKLITYDELRFDEIVLIFDNGNVVPYSLLSDGLRNLLALVSDLCWRAATLNPWMKDKINEVHGIVLIDEVDLHLHPSWQRMVIPQLLMLFPNIQFFITTHSPLVLASLEPYIADPAPNVFILNEQGFRELTNEKIGTADNWLKDVYGLVEPRSIEGEEILVEAKHLLANMSNDKKKLLETHQQLQVHIQAHDPFWIRWNHYLMLQSIEP
jgi:predicted ATP-binding protein involved in virulence